MNLTININSVDRTSDVNWESFAINDAINDKVNTCVLSISKSGAVVPEAGQTIEVLDGATKIFAGTILRVDRSIKDELLEEISIEAVDYTHNLNRSNVVESYTKETVHDIIADVLDNHHSDFTYANVVCATEIETFNISNLSAMAIIQKLADQVNYYWYVDYDKDVHFFKKYSSYSPFDLTDTNGKYVYNSLRIISDISQLKNIVKIRGGEYEGDARIETHDGDATKLIFSLSNKFAHAPTVTVGGSAKTVGIEYLSVETDFDCFWSFQEKYLRFKVAPADSANNISVEGIPLVPVLVQVREEGSIAQYGEFEFFKRDTSIESKEEARQYADAQLDAYKNSIIEGSFRTYESGLLTGQIITIQSDRRSIEEDFLIQNVSLQMEGFETGTYKISLATIKTINLIEYLRDLLISQDEKIELDATEIVTEYYNKYANISIAETITREVAEAIVEAIGIVELIRDDPFVPVWILGPYFPTSDSDVNRAMRLGISSYLY